MIFHAPLVILTHCSNHRELLSGCGSLKPIADVVTRVTILFAFDYIALIGKFPKAMQAMFHHAMNTVTRSVQVQIHTKHTSNSLACISRQKARDI